MERLAATRGGLPDEVDVGVTQREGGGRFGLPVDPAQHRAHARQQFLGAERLDEIIIRADIQALDAIFHLSLGCQHEDRHGIREPPQLGADGIAV